MKQSLKLVAVIFSCLGSAVVAQSSGISLGGSKHDATLPVEITADTLSVDQSSNSASFSGNARVGQGELRLGADQIAVRYDQSGGQISSVTAAGNVVFTNGVDMAEAANAVYDVATGGLVMTGNVLLVQGQTAISGDRMVLNILDNTARVSGNVKTVLTPK
jgi:lipopolysaccharide export system protein LptA